MTAPQLLEAIEARGGVARVKDNGGAIVLNVAPLTLARELAPDIRELKPQLIELLESAPVHRWKQSAPNAPDVASDAPANAQAPDVAQLSAALAEAKRGAWVIPSPLLLAQWRALQTFTGARLTARHLGALAQLHADKPQLDNAALLNLWAAGIQPDNGDGAAVWCDPDLLADEAREIAKATAKQNEVTK